MPWAFSLHVAKSEIAIFPDLAHVSYGSWSCQNGLRGVGAGSHGPGVVSQVAIAAISGLMPTMFMTRVRL
jgi:hypothetical protein